MPSIGAYDFLSLRGDLVPGNAVQVEEITRPGVGGIAYRHTGARGEPFRMVSLVDTATAAAAATLLRNYKALQGYLTTLADDTGQIWTNVMVLRVTPDQPRQVLAASGIVYLVRCEWALQMTEWQ